jgi:hypothetical protein
MSLAKAGGTGQLNVEFRQRGHRSKQVEAMEGLYYIIFYFILQ